MKEICTFVVHASTLNAKRLCSALRSPPTRILAAGIAPCLAFVTRPLTPNKNGQIEALRLSGPSVSALATELARDTRHGVVSGVASTNPGRGERGPNRGHTRVTGDPVQPVLCTNVLAVCDRRGAANRYAIHSLAGKINIPRSAKARYVVGCLATVVARDAHRPRHVWFLPEASD